MIVDRKSFWDSIIVKSGKKQTVVSNTTLRQKNGTEEKSFFSLSMLI